MNTESSNSEKLLLSFGIAASLLTYVVLCLIVPHFADMFKSFGGDLPFPTLFLVEFYRASFLLPIPVVLAWHLSPKRSRGTWSFLTGAFCLFGITGLSVVLLYWPIFELGQSI